MVNDESSARRRELGSELRRLREKAGFQGKDIARTLGWAESKVSRVETGLRGISEMEAAIYLATCRVRPDELRRLLDLHAEVENGVWLRRHNPPTGVSCQVCKPEVYQDRLVG